MTTLEDAIALAVRHHAGQVDKSGQPYILHPLRLMLQLEEDEARILAVLHDLVEDTPITLEDLETSGFAPSILRALDCLTHRPGESYEDYILRVMENQSARQVKLLDLQDNMDLRRLDHTPGDADWLRLKKYRRAWATLMGLPPA